MVIDKDVEHLRDEVSELRAAVTDQAKELAELSKGINDLLTAWKAAGLMVAFTKWAAGLVTAILGAWLAYAKLKD